MDFSQPNMKHKEDVKVFSEKRKCPRYDVSWTLVEYHIHTDIHREPYVGVIINASDLGVCMNTAGQLDIGQTMKIESSVPEFSRTALVRWVENITLSFCRAGL
jgi:hypothetical protein